MWFSYIALQINDRPQYYNNLEIINLSILIYITTFKKKKKKQITWQLYWINELASANLSHMMENNFVLIIIYSLIYETSSLDITFLGFLHEYINMQAN